MAADGPDGPSFYPKGTKWLATLSKTPATALNVQYSRSITLTRWDQYRVPLHLKLRLFIVLYLMLIQIGLYWRATWKIKVK